jgi:hypothetical protein
MLRQRDCASIGILRADPSRKTPCSMWLELGAATAEVLEALNAGTHRRCELISSAVRLARMESFLSAYRGSSTQAYNYNCARHHGDNAIVLRQALHVPDVQACKHCAEIQDSPAGEGVAEEEDAQTFRSVIP